jgi:hypothetical protein
MVVCCVPNAFQTPNREYSEELEEEMFHSAGLFVVENVESFADAVYVASREYVLFFTFLKKLFNED